MNKYVAHTNIEHFVFSSIIHRIEYEQSLLTRARANHVAILDAPSLMHHPCCRHHYRWMLSVQVKFLIKMWLIKINSLAISNNNNNLLFVIVVIYKIPIKLVTFLLPCKFGHRNLKNKRNNIYILYIKYPLPVIRDSLVHTEHLQFPRLCRAFHYMKLQSARINTFLHDSFEHSRERISSFLSST